MANNKLEESLKNSALVHWYMKTYETLRLMLRDGDDFEQLKRDI